MGAKDTKAKEYLSDNERFADLCNVVLFAVGAVSRVLEMMQHYIMQELLPLNVKILRLEI